MILALSGSTPPFFTEVAALIVAGAAIAYLGSRLGLVPIVGFLLAGVVIGPNGVGIVRDRELVDAAAEVGVVLLLFTIGIEFSFERLARIRRLIFGAGGLQVTLATGATTAVLAALGVGWRDALFTGLLVALSSTAIVLKLLDARGESSSDHGQVGLGVLIFQDLAIIPMVLLVPLLGGGGGSGAGIGLALLRAAAIIAAVLLFARRLMPPLVERVARTCSPELFLLTVIAVCFGTAWLTSLAGVSLSLGAFLAGLLVSESRFSEHALGEILPLQILFSATFFVSVGMLLDLEYLVRHPVLVLAAVLGVAVVKLLTTAASARAMGYPLPVALASGLTLAQIGEFSFVLERAGREVGLSPGGLAGEGSQAFIATAVLLMIATPAMTALGARLGRRMEARGGAAARAGVAPDEDAGHLPPLENHVVVAGYGQAARRLVRVLSGSGVPFVITTLSPEGASEAESLGFPVLRGDSGRARTLQLAGAERAKMMVIADDDPGMAFRIASVGRSLNPTMRILVRTRYEAEVEPLARAGVDRVVAEELEGVVRLFGEVLREYRVAPAEIGAHEAAARQGGYAVLRADEPEAAAALLPACELGDDCFATRTVTIRPGAPAAGRTLGSLRLPDEYGLAPRGATPELLLVPGTELVLAGSADAFARAAPLFRAEGEPDADAPAPAARASAVDPERAVAFVPADPDACPHLEQIRPVHPGSRGCEECLRLGTGWVHLRLCLTCGHVGCCDSSPLRHATAHFHATGHPVMRSAEPGEEWGWCYVDGLPLSPAPRG